MEQSHPLINEVILNAIKNDDSQTLSFMKYEDAVFYKKGIQLEFENIITAKSICQICNICWNDLQKFNTKKKIPSKCVANKMWIGDVPEELKDLTLPEQHVIALYRHNQCVLKFESVYHSLETQQSKLKGNCISFPQNISNIASTLPLALNELAHSIKIIFVGTFIPNAINFKNIMCIRRQKVFNALKWLINNNHLYKNVKICQNNLELLPENDVPKVLLDTMKIYKTKIDEKGYVDDPLKEHNFLIENETPIDISAIVDTDGINITNNNLNKEILSKIHNDESQDSLYAIPHTGEPVNEYYNPNLLMSLYPTLFPYGFGGIEDITKPTSVSFEKHIEYLLSYADHRFERNHSFMFIAFNILQKRMACRQARLLISRPYFGKTASMIQDISIKDIETALHNISMNTYSAKKNPKVHTLMQQIRTVGGSIKGSNFSRAKCRNEIHSIIYEKGLPSIFITINPADIHSRVALYFAGVNMDIDKILADDFPSIYKRASIIAKNPVSTARFFDKLITTLLDTLICPKNEEVGVLGPISNYYGTVEIQDRGSLHVHILLWLGHSLSPNDLHEKLKNKEFQTLLLEYLEDIIKQDLDDFNIEVETETTDLISCLEEENLTLQQVTKLNNCELSEKIIKNIYSGIPKIQNIETQKLEKQKPFLSSTCLLTPNPHWNNFENIFKMDLCRIICETNIHKCKKTCFKYAKSNEKNPECRSKFPRKLVPISKIDEITGNIELKRNDRNVNNYNPIISSAVRCNTDIKFIWNGHDAKALVYYITDYITKNNLSFYDTCGLISRSMENEQKYNINQDDDINEKSRKMIIRCYNAIASQQQLSGVQVASYLMKWPDYYSSNKFQNLFLIGIERYLQNEFDLKKENKDINVDNVTDQIYSDEILENEYESDNENENEFGIKQTTEEEQFLIEITSDVKTKKKSIAFHNTRIDYQYRPLDSTLEATCLYDYIGNYEIEKIKKNNLEVDENTSKKKITLQRFNLHPKHPLATTHVLKLRSYKTPVIIGPQIPNKNKKDTIERYSRAILTLFYPWRSIDDLCNLNNTWEESLNERIYNIPEILLKKIENIQLLHDCKLVRDNQIKQKIVSDLEFLTSDDKLERIKLHNEVNNYEEDYDEIFVNYLNENTLTNSGYNTKLNQYILDANLTTAKMSKFKLSEKYRNLLQNFQAKTDNKFLKEDFNNFIIADKSIKHQAQKNLNLLKNLTDNAMLTNLSNDQMLTIKNAKVIIINTKDKITANLPENKEHEKVTRLHPQAESRNFVVNHFNLNEEQKRAFLIITEHLDDEGFLVNEDYTKEQLIMVIAGCGGTGKSRIINALTYYFDCTNRSEMLGKFAPTAKAASLINGVTIQSCQKRRTLNKNIENNEEFIDTPSKLAYKKRKTAQNTYQINRTKSVQQKFGKIKYGVCDEYSMCGQCVLAGFHRCLTMSNTKNEKIEIPNDFLDDNGIPFGGVNIIYCGDILQYEPVQDTALYKPVHTDDITEENLEENNNTKHILKTDDYKEVNKLKNEIKTKKKKNVNDNTPTYVERNIGRSLYLQTKYAVVLQEQMRVVDRRYLELLDRLRNFECNKNDHELLLTRVVGSKNCNVKTLDDTEWRDATMLVFSNEVRQEINNHTAISRASEEKKILFVSVAEDIVTFGKNVVPKTCTNILKNILKLTDDKTDDLPGLLPLLPEMPVMLTENICTKLGLTNGTNGIFKKLIYEEEEDITVDNENLLFPTDSTKFIRKPIAAIIEIPTFKIDGVFEGLDSKLIPIPLVETTFTVSSNRILTASMKNIFSKKKVEFKVKRTQFPLIPAYAITTYKAQGQTLKKVIIDLVLPPFGKKEFATVYVPLSRATSLNNILILRDFKFESLKIEPTIYQKLELERIIKMDLETKILYYKTHK